MNIKVRAATLRILDMRTDECHAVHTCQSHRSLVASATEAKLTLQLLLELQTLTVLSSV